MGDRHNAAEALILPPGPIMCPCCGTRTNVILSPDQNALIVWNPEREAYEGQRYSPAAYELLQEELKALYGESGGTVYDHDLGGGPA